MKSYIYSKTEAKNGNAYTLTIWRNKGTTARMELVGLTGDINYATDHGENGEAWQVILAHPKEGKAIRRLFKSKRIPLDPNYAERIAEAGILLQEV